MGVKPPGDQQATICTVFVGYSSAQEMQRLMVIGKIMTNKTKLMVLKNRNIFNNGLYLLGS